MMRSLDDSGYSGRRIKDVRVIDVFVWLQRNCKVRFVPERLRRASLSADSLSTRERRFQDILRDTSHALMSTSLGIATLRLRTINHNDQYCNCKLVFEDLEAVLRSKGYGVQSTETTIRLRRSS